MTRRKYPWQDMEVCPVCGETGPCVNLRRTGPRVERTSPHPGRHSKAFRAKEAQLAARKAELAGKVLRGEVELDRPDMVPR